MEFSMMDFKHLPKPIYMSLRRALTEMQAQPIRTMIKNRALVDVYDVKETLDRTLASEKSKKRRGTYDLRKRAINELVHYLYKRITNEDRTIK